MPYTTIVDVNIGDFISRRTIEPARVLALMDEIEALHNFPGDRWAALRAWLQHWGEGYLIHIERQSYRVRTPIDSQTCEWCARQNGRILQLTAAQARAQLPFAACLHTPSGGASPDDKHPGCRCTLELLTDKEEGA